MPSTTYLTGRGGAAALVPARGVVAFGMLRRGCGFTEHTAFAFYGPAAAVDIGAAFPRLFSAILFAPSCLPFTLWLNMRRRRGTLNGGTIFSVAAWHADCLDNPVPTCGSLRRNCCAFCAGIYAAVFLVGVYLYFASFSSLNMARGERGWDGLQSVGLPPWDLLPSAGQVISLFSKALAPRYQALPSFELHRQCILYYSRDWLLAAPGACWRSSWSFNLPPL